MAILGVMQQDRNHEKAKKVLENPASLAPHVKVLSLLPDSNHWEVKHGRYSRLYADVWTSDPPIQMWFPLRRWMNWKHPIQSIRHFSRSRETLNTALAVIPHLTQLRKLSFLTWDDLHVRPSPAPYYYTLFASFRANNLRCLCLGLYSSSLHILAGVMRTSRIVFESLETIDLQLTINGNDQDTPTDFAEDLRVIVDCGRNSLIHFRASYTPFNDAHPLVTLFSALGVIPKLASFDFTSLHSLDETPICDFLLQHHSTLKRITLNIVAQDTFPRLPGENTGQSPKLASLFLFYRFLEPNRWTISPSLKVYANTLTTLVVSPWCLNIDSRGPFTHDYVPALLLSLSRPLYRSPLRRLKIAVLRLYPDIFDLLSSYLEDLHTLDLTYHTLIGRRNQESVDETAFWHNILSRSYPNWGLERLDLCHCFSNAVLQHLDSDQVRVLTGVFPSVKDFGVIDWSDQFIDTPEAA
ncbi:hypothetical protein BDN72DRAFT_849184, partial [Pluteus cervinus]